MSDRRSDEVFMLTGSLGCIGAWALRNLVAEGTRVIATDLPGEPLRPRLIMSDDEINRITWATLDVTDPAAVKEMVARHQVTHIIHLAGLQVPGCRANPSLGAQVNVTGTVNIFEAARAHWGQVRGLAYASSLAVLGPAELYPNRPVRDDVMPAPATLYGVYKLADEGIARMYWQDWQIPSIGLRPYIVYGVGRDQGMTSDIAKAMLAVAADRPYHIRFGDAVALQYADDVAKIFVGCARSGYQGATSCLLRNDVVAVSDFVSRLKSRYPAARITHAAAPLPFPADLDDSGLRAILGGVPHTPLDAALDATVGMFRDLVRQGRIDLRQLDV
jgi:nucleoside-diphosphate-sugar epimerase